MPIPMSFRAFLSPLAVSRLDPFQFQEPAPGLFISDDSAAGGGGGGVSLIQKAQGLRARLEARGAGPDDRASVFQDYRTTLEFFPQGPRDAVRELLAGARLLRGWIDGPAGEAQILGLKEYSGLIASAADGITGEMDLHDEAVLPEMDWHGARMQDGPEPRFLIPLLEAMPFLAKLNLKALPSAEFGSFAAFVLQMFKGQFEELAKEADGEDVRQAYRNASAALAERMAEGLLEVLATSKETEVLQRANEALVLLFPHLPRNRAEEIDSQITVLLHARMSIIRMAGETGDAVYASNRGFALAVSRLPAFLVRRVIALQAEVVQTLCRNRPGEDHFPRVFSTLMLLIPLLELEPLASSLVHLMRHVEALLGVLPPAKKGQAPKGKNPRAERLAMLYATWERIFSTKLSRHPSPYVKDAAQTTALQFHRLQATPTGIH